MGTQRGFTLLEILVAVAIAAIVTSSAIFGWHELDRRWRLESATRQIELDLRLARIGAISEASAQRIRFDDSGTFYHREVRTPGGSYRKRSKPVTMPRGVRVTGCTARGRAVSFQTRGNAGSFGTITVTGPGGDHRRVVVDIAGRVRVTQ